jgi:peptide/nickel transport system permease protein
MKAILRQVGYVAVENPLSAVGFAILVILVFLAILGPLIAPYDPLAPLSVSGLQPPSAEYWLGTDQLGRDILSRLIDALRR